MSKTLSGTDVNISRTPQLDSPENNVSQDHDVLSDSKRAQRDNILNRSDREYRLYAYRWFELALYCAAILTCQMTWVSLSPVASSVNNAYGKGSATISFIGLIFLIVFIVVFYPSSWIIKKAGLRFGVLLGMLLTVIGMVLKCLVNYSFSWVIVGQVIAALGKTLLAIAPAKLATYWFGPNEKVIATTIATVAQPAGVVVGFAFPSIFVKTADAEAGEENVANARHHIFQSFFYQAIISVIVFILLIIFFKEKPRKPPSSTAGNAPAHNVFELNKKVLKDGNFWRLLITFGIIFGTVQTYGTMLGVLANFYGYKDSDASIFGTVFFCGGITGSLILGSYVQKTKKYKASMVVVSFVAIIGPLALLAAFHSGKAWPVSVAAFVCGLELAILPVGIDFGVELTFPDPEPISTSLLMSFAMLVGVVMVVSGQAMVSKFDEGGLWAQLMFILMAVFGLIFASLIKEDLKRVAYEKELYTGLRKPLKFEEEYESDDSDGEKDSF